MTLEEQALKYRIRGIPANLVDRFWPLCEAYIKRALDHTLGEYSPQNIREYCKDRVLQLWLVSEGDRIVAAVTTEIINYPNRKHCRVVTLGGSKAVEWTELLVATLSEWAKEQGCEVLEANVRKGFVPVLAGYGFKHLYSAVYKPIE